MRNSKSAVDEKRDVNMSDFHFHNKEEYAEAVAEAIERIDGVCISEAVRLVEENSEAINYGLRMKIGADAVAGSILGIKNC